MNKTYPKTNFIWQILTKTAQSYANYTTTVVHQPTTVVKVEK